MLFWHKKSAQRNASYEVNIYCLIDFEATGVTLFNMKFCVLLGVCFDPKQDLKNPKIPKFA